MRHSILDLAPVPDGSDVAQALENTRELAQRAEVLGYHRYWLAEHHNMPGIASAATPLVIAHVAAATSTIRVGSGGIMLPNHSPLVIAEQFGTLATLYPGRIDLGLGRAPGTDMATARALRRNMSGEDTFPNDVVELIEYFETNPDARIRAIPGEGTQVPVWLLGSSLYGAQLAAYLGLPYAFASHFAPDYLEQAAETYRHNFRPSQYLDQPYFMMGMGVFAADTDEEAVFLKSSMQQAFANLRTGRPGKLPRPARDVDRLIPPEAKLGVERALACSVTGSPEIIARGFADWFARLKPDEVILASQIHDHAARLRCYEITAEVLRNL